MNSIPENLTPIATILTLYLTPLWQWLSTLVYERLIPLNEQHLLCILNKLVDFSTLESVCTSYHQSTGKGRPVVHTVPRMLRAMTVKYLYNCSLRQLEEKIRYDIVVKWFVGYPIFAYGPDHTTLERFDAYLSLHHPRLFFDTILTQIDVAFPNDRIHPQLGDTFAMHANAALESLVKRLRHTAQALLLAYQAADADAYARLWAQVDEVALFGQAAETTECYLSVEQRHQRLLATVDAALHCLRLIQQTRCTPAVTTWVQRLEKILNDELTWEWEEDGRLRNVSLLSNKKRGQYRICSATDPEATIRNHGPGKKDFGYNVSVAATSDFIREIQADTGSRPDAEAIPELLQSQIDQHAVCPDTFIYDQAAGRGKTAYLVEQVSDGCTQLVAKPLPGKREKERFAPEDFTLSEDGLALTCPHHRVSRRQYRSGSGDGHTFRFIAAQCLGCPFLKPCRGQEKLPTTHKSVFISAYRAQWDGLVAYSQTADFKHDMALRPQVERVIAGLVLHNGARRARFRGLEKVDFQAKMCATAYNLKRWVSLRSGKRHKKRRRFGAPPPSQGGVGLVPA